MPQMGKLLFWIIKCEVRLARLDFLLYNYFRTRFINFLFNFHLIWNPVFVWILFYPSHLVYLENECVKFKRIFFIETVLLLSNLLVTVSKEKFMWFCKKILIYIFMEKNDAEVVGTRRQQHPMNFQRWQSICSQLSNNFVLSTNKGYGIKLLTNCNYHWKNNFQMLPKGKRPKGKQAKRPLI